MRYLLTWILLLPLACAAALGTDETHPSPARPAGKSWLGVWLNDTVDGGAQVVALVPGGPGQRAGLQVGDILVRADDVELTGQDRLRKLLADLKPGASLRLTVLRGGSPVDRVVLAGSRPAPRAPRTSVTSSRAPVPGLFRVESPLLAETLGLRVAEITPALRRHYGAPEDAGVLVTGIDRGKLADLAGVEVGDVLVALDEREIVAAEQLSSVVWEWNGGRPLQAFVVRAEQSRQVVLSAGSPPRAGESVLAGTAVAPRARRSARSDVEAERLRLEIEQLELELARLKQRLAALKRAASSASP